MDTTTTQDINRLIEELELKQLEQYKKIQLGFDNLATQLEPLNIVKNSLQELKIDTSLSKKVVSGLFGIGVGYLTKRFLKEDSHDKLRNLMATLLQTELNAEAKQQSDTILLYSKLAYTLISQFTAKKSET